MKVTVISLTTSNWFLNSHTLTCRCCSICSLIATYTPEDHLLSNCHLQYYGFAFGGFTALTLGVLFLCYGNRFLATWTLTEQVLNFFCVCVLKSYVVINHCIELKKLKTKKKLSCNFSNVNILTLASKSLCKTWDTWMWGIFSAFFICVDVLSVLLI